MNNEGQNYHVGIVLMLGSLWGLSEAGLGIALKACASTASGSIMTSVALFFIAATWALTRRIGAVALLVGIACAFKVFDAAVLSLPLKHGAVVNPIFAFITEGFLFILIVALLGKIAGENRKSRILSGGVSAAAAAGIFPLVKYATGIPACVFAGTSIPLSILFAPLAVILSCLTVPFGLQAGERLKSVTNSGNRIRASQRLIYIASPVTLVLCLVIIAFVRLV